jgi:hypothetical protein
LAHREINNSADCRVVAIDLAEAEVVTGDAVRALVRAEAEGIELRSCPACVRYWITNERDSTLGPGSVADGLSQRRS